MLISMNYFQQDNVTVLYRKHVFIYLLLRPEKTVQNNEIGFIYGAINVEFLCIKGVVMGYLSVWFSPKYLDIHHGQSKKGLSLACKLQLGVYIKVVHCLCLWISKTTLLS